MREDLKAALRALRASPTFTAVALIVLMLGLGATTAIFSVVDAVVLRALPFDEHDRLVAVGERRRPSPDFPPDPGRDPDALMSAAPQNYMDWALQQEVFESMAAIAGGALTLREPGGEPEELRGQRVTAGFFDVLRVHPLMGRAFTAANEVDGEHRVVILSDGLWRRRFGGDADVVGRRIPLEGASYEVVGVMPPDFAYPVGSAWPTDVWVPYVVPADERVRRPNWMSVYLQSIARLRPGVSIEQAQANMTRIAAALERAHPDWNKDNLIGVRPLHDHLVGARIRQWMLLLLGAVALVLLIACANVANLLLARATTREREIGIRAAMGAGRWRLVRQLLVESVVLSAIGTVLAVVLAWWGVAVLKAAMPDGLPRVTTIAVDLRVLGAAALLSLVTGLLFGVAPALQLSRPDLTHALKEGARGASSGATRQRIRGLLVVTEVAIAVVLLVGAGLFIGSFAALMRIDPGFNPEGVLTAQLFPDDGPRVADGPPPTTAPRIEEVLARIRQIPGVQHASFIAGGMPLGGSMSSTTITIAGREIPSDQRSISIRRVSTEYFDAMEMPIIEGRPFTSADRDGAAPVVVINRSAAARYFPGESALGRMVGINGERMVIGVVGDVYQSSLETEPRTEAYVPMGQRSVTGGELVVRTSGDPLSAVAAVRSASLAVFPDVPLRNVRTLEQVIAGRVAQRRLNMLLIGLFGLLGLVIAAVGIYGVLAYLVSQRTREIGVRMALGATRGAVIRLVLRSAGTLVLVGLAAGGVGAWYLSATAEAFLFRMDRNDPRVFAAALGILLFAAMLACLLPAHRAAGVDPNSALRSE